MFTPFLSIKLYETQFGGFMYSIIKLLIISLFTLSLLSNLFAIEEAEYEVIQKDDDFELRRYSEYILAETVVGGDMEDAGNKAFKDLFGYISGDNQLKEEVAMTLPVSQKSRSQEISMTAPVGQTRSGDDWVVSFMMPSSYTMKSIPEPTNSKVKIREVPERLVASIEYSGFWSEENYLENKDELEKWIKEKGFEAKGDPIWARYNSPWSLWFLRRNEVLIPVEYLVKNE